jgi:DNA-binding CsgD family transcriptional regulator
MACTSGLLALFFTGQISPYAAQEPLSHNASLSFLICGAAAVVLMLGSGAVMYGGLRRLLAAASIAVALAWGTAMLLLGVLPILDDPKAASVHLALNASGQILTMLLLVQWNLHISLCRFSEIALIATLSLLAAACIYLLGSWLVSPVPLVVALIGISAGCNIVLEIAVTGNSGSPYSLSNTGRMRLQMPSGEGLSRTNIALFFGSRLLWGVVVGVFVGGLSFGEQLPPVSFFMTAASVLVLVLFALLVLIVKSNKRSTVALLTASTLVVALVIVECFFSGDFSQLMRPLAAIIVLVWIVQLRTQLLAFEAMLKVRPGVFVYCELLAPYATCCFVSAAIRTLFMPMGLGGHAASIEAIAMLAFFVIALLSLADHVLRYFPSLDHGHDQDVIDQKQLSITSLSAAHNLTPRETEVLYYVALGYSRPYIEKVLYISKGTAKAHIHHIYQKLDVATQDELIEMVRDFHGASGS